MKTVMQPTRAVPRFEDKPIFEISKPLCLWSWLDKSAFDTEYYKRIVCVTMDTFLRLPTHYISQIGKIEMRTYEKYPAGRWTNSGTGCARRKDSWRSPEHNPRVRYNIKPEKLESFPNFKMEFKFQIEFRKILEYFLDFTKGVS